MGLNQIATLNVPTSNGEGTASDLNTMAADKTIELSGTYVGRFVILGSHDGTLYVPLAIFDSGGGAQAFKQVVKVTTRYLKVLRKTSSGGTVVISVAAETTALNNYIALATLTTGATGPQASIDLWTLVASTGLEGGVSFFGRGSLGGTIVVEGSLDNTNWNPLGEFDSGLLVGGEAMGFSPIVANEIVRYVRVNVVGVVGSAGFSITLGGVQNTTGDSGNAPADATYLTLSTNAQLTNERVFTVVQANGLTGTDNGAGLTFTLTNNLITGLAGGQTVVGGTASGEALTINGSNHANGGAVALNIASNLNGGQIRVTSAGAGLPKLRLGSLGSDSWYLSTNFNLAFGVYAQDQPAGTSFLLQTQQTNALQTSEFNLYSAPAGAPASLALILGMSGDGAMTMTGRLQQDKGANVASASTLTLGRDGNVFTITGTNNISYITTTGWQAGSVVKLIFADALSVVNNGGAPPANTAPILVQGGANFATAANSMVTLTYTGTAWLAETFSN